MSENLILVVDYEKICRLCLQTTGAMSDIFNMSEETSLRDLILRATGLKMTMEDGLPSKICHRCRYVVELACELRDMAAKTHLLLASAGGGLSETSSRDDKLAGNTLGDTLHETGKQKTENVAKEHTEINKDLQDNRTFKVTGEETKTKIEITENIDMKKENKGDNSEFNQEKTKTEPAPSKSRKAVPKHLTCQICLTPFKSTSEVATHVDTHYAGTGITSYLKQQRPFKCEVCHNKVVTKTQLIVHHRKHFNVNPFTCKHAGCTFVGRNQDSLRHHVVCHGARSQVCEWCGAAFRRRWELTAHSLRAHAGGAGGGTAGGTQCRPCRKHFRNKLTLQAHLYNHHRPARYVCEWAGCSKAFPSPGPLAAHARTHAGDRVYKCSLCDAAAYTTQSMLNRHLRMHERARLSKCDKCAATFDDYGAFYRHRVAQHGPWKPFRCRGCYKGYQSEEKLQIHTENCEQAIRVQEATANSKGERTALLVASIGEVTENKPLAMDSEDLVERFKGQALLVQPGNIEHLSKELDKNTLLQDLPPDGLLYIEVDSDGKEEAVADSWRQ